MASSDEEGEIVPDCITNYHFVDSKEEPISFSVLPLQWSENEIPEGTDLHVFLRGSADDGLLQIYKKVVAWKFDLSFVLPEVYVLSKDKAWIKLHRPRKSCETTVKSILLTVHFLHFVKKNPVASGEAIWNHLLKAFSSYNVEPSQTDLLPHAPLISEAAKRDKDIKKSEYLVTFLLETSGERKAPHEENRPTNKYKFIVDVDDYDDDNDENSDELFDSVCAFCDNGGELLCCEGSCIRSFHATSEAGADCLCESLGYTDAQVEAIQIFLCKNCQSEQHQCFVCGILGSSIKSSDAEVFHCASATCGNFYHPQCVAKLLHPWEVAQAEELQQKIASGESFTCPAHKCIVCKQVEDKNVLDLQFAICRRCPKAYHRKCLPRKIAFEHNYEENIQQRAWDGLLQHRILIYCMDHKIIPELGTPKRNHISFPDVDGKKKQHNSKMLASKEKVVKEEKSTVSEPVKGRTVVKMQNPVVKEYSPVMGIDSTKGFSREGFKPKINEVTGMTRRAIGMSVSTNGFKSSTADHKKLPLRNDQSKSLLSTRLHLDKPKQQNLSGSTSMTKNAAKPIMDKASSSRPFVDPEMEKRIVALMKKSSASFNMEEFIKKQRTLSGNAYSKSVMDKTMTTGRVEGSVKAVRTALRKLEEGCTIEDAKAICEPKILGQITRWKRKLRVYLAPFLHGMRYTSFGRHFTNLDKLAEIVDRLHWYVQDGDMIVDFCCGSNDFSWLMQEKLNKMGKSCSFMNYDLITPKNDFSFEKRDWMTVQPSELPIGSRLIMGLNPPFGVQAALANKFIEKALKFRPKLLILIVPRETERLDEKDSPYDIVWEDDELLSGKSFYLPGSVDIQNKQLEDWNLDPPPLYLWSRPDWSAKHREIAQKHGHLYKEQKTNNAEKVVSNYLMEENQDCYGDFSNIVNGYGDISSILDDVPEDLDDAETEGARAIDTPQIGQLDGVRPIQNNDMCVDMELASPNYSPLYNAGYPRSFAYNPSAALQTPLEMNTQEPGFLPLQPSISGHPMRFGADYASGYGQMNVGAFPSWPTSTVGAFPSWSTNTVGAFPTWPTSTGHGLNNGSFYMEDQVMNYGKDNVENLKSNGWIMD